MVWRIVSLLMLAFLPASTALAAGRSFVAWPADALEKVFSDAKPPSDSKEMLSLRAARGEYESGQIVVLAGDRIDALRASATEFEKAGGGIIPEEKELGIEHNLRRKS